MRGLNQATLEYSAERTEAFDPNYNGGLLPILGNGSESREYGSH